MQFVQRAQGRKRIIARPVIADARKVPVEIDAHGPPIKALSGKPVISHLPDERHEAEQEAYTSLPVSRTEGIKGNDAVDLSLNCLTMEFVRNLVVLPFAGSRLFEQLHALLAYPHRVFQECATAEEDAGHPPESFLGFVRQLEPLFGCQPGVKAQLTHFAFPRREFDIGLGHFLALLLIWKRPEIQVEQNDVRFGDTVSVQFVKSASSDVPA